MAHELFRITKASAQELDLIVYGGAAGLVVMLLLIWFLVWRDRRKLARSPGSSRTRTKRSKRR